MAIAIIAGGEPRFYGVKVEDDSTLVFDNHQFVFEIGSITKVFTATLLAQLLVDMSNPHKDYDEATLRTYLTQKLEMAHPPGEVSEYSNLGGGLLGYVLEQVTARSCRQTRT